MDLSDEYGVSVETIANIITNASPGRPPERDEFNAVNTGYRRPPCFDTEYHKRERDANVAWAVKAMRAPNAQALRRRAAAAEWITNYRKRERAALAATVGGKRLFYNFRFVDSVESVESSKRF